MNITIAEDDFSNLERAIANGRDEAERSRVREIQRVEEMRRVANLESPGSRGAKKRAARRAKKKIGRRWILR